MADVVSAGTTRLLIPTAHSISFPLVFRLQIVTSPGKRTSHGGGVTSQAQRVKYNTSQSMGGANVSATAAGNIQIVEVDPAGKFIQIRNMSDKVRMGDCSLKVCCMPVEDVRLAICVCRCFVTQVSSMTVLCVYFM